MDKLGALPRAIRVHAEPDIFLVPEFVSQPEALLLAKLHHTRVRNRDLTYNRSCVHRSAGLFGPQEWRQLKTLDRWFPPGHPEFAHMACVTKGTPADETIRARAKRSNIPHSVSTVHDRGDTAIIDEISQRVETRLGLDRANSALVQLLSYGPNQAYRAHVDCLPSLHQNRAATLLIYLSDEQQVTGGETHFPALNLSIAPRRGMALVWGNLNESKMCDHRTEHVAKPVRSGTKLAWQQWFYRAPEVGRDFTDHETLVDSAGSRDYFTAPGTTHLRKASAQVEDAIKLVRRCSNAVCEKKETINALRLARRMRTRNPRHASIFCQPQIYLLAPLLHSVRMNQTKRAALRGSLDSLYQCALNTFGWFFHDANGLWETAIDFAVFLAETDRQERSRQLLERVISLTGHGDLRRNVDVTALARAKRTLQYLAPKANTSQLYTAQCALDAG